MKEGFSIAVDGIDGCGKSTQVDLLVKELKRRYGDDMVLHTREIGSWHDNTTTRLREILLDPETKASKKALQILHIAQCLIHHENVVKPAVDSGKIVVKDRSSLSFFSYGSASMDGQEDEWLCDLIDIASLDHEDLIVIFHIDEEEANARLVKRRQDTGENIDMVEGWGRDLQRRVAKTFEAISDRSLNDGPVFGLKVTGLSQTEVHSSLVDCVDTFLKRREARQKEFDSLMERVSEKETDDELSEQVSPAVL